MEKESKQKNLLEHLNPEQAKAVQHQEGPLLILAGAGSGKTRVITHRIAWLVEILGVEASEILAITFTNKAANEMKKRISELLGSYSQGMWIGTFHATMLRILRRYAERIGFKNQFTILDSKDQLDMIKKCLKDLDLDEKQFPARQIHSRISTAKNAMISAAEYQKNSQGIKEKEQVAVLYLAYQEALRKNNAMDFDDILYYAVELFEENKDILEYYQNKFRYILVDEYQDTNHSQYMLIHLLAARHRNICVVGDDDQSIYSFRGANIRNILDFEKDFKNCQVIKLEQNYRSTESILGAANAVIKQNKSRTQKKLWTDKESGDLLTFYRGENQSDEARYIASEIIRLHKRSQQQVSFGEMAILYRVNALSRNIEFALKDQGIPYSIYGGTRFFDRKEIKDTLAYLRLIILGDDLSLRRVLNVPKRGLGDKSIEQLEALAAEQQQSMLEICGMAEFYPELKRVAAALVNFHQLIQNMRQQVNLNEMSLMQFVEWVETESGLIDELINQKEKMGLDAVNRLENMKELLSDVQEFESNYVFIQDDDDMEANQLSEQTNVGLTDLLTAFLERTALYSDLDSSDSIETVSLMTIHSAKGLEFNTVFLVGTEEGIFPGYRSLGQEKDLEEERRLAYVAMTRAEKKLYITTAKERLLFGKTQRSTVSRFICEVPESYIEELGGSRFADDYSAAFSSDKINAGSLGNQQYQKKETRFKSASRSAAKIKADNTGSGIAIEQLKTGMKILHSKFGEGKIKEIIKVAGDAILVIDFGDREGKYMASLKALSLV